MNSKDIFTLIENYQTDLILLRRKIHANPELSFQEFQTSALIQKYLTDLGVNFQILASTGVVAHIGNPDHPCIALRADIDALPILEETGLECSSQNKGIMHACGHDFHTSILLICAAILKSQETQLKKYIKLIFQPAEEKIPGGASIMIKEAVLENPKPNAIFGLHIEPSTSTGQIAVNHGPILASADELYWTIKGKGCHAAQPHVGNDCVLAASHLVMHLNTLMTKFRNPLNPGVLSVTSIHGGSATNIFPDEVKLMGTLRAFNEDLRSKMHELIRENSKAICSLYGCDCDVEVAIGYPHLNNDRLQTEYVQKVASEILGESNVLTFEPKMWAEDFAFYAKEIPACFFFLGVQPEDSELPPLHNARLSPDENALKIGVAMMVGLCNY
ncbi:MAG: M20 family metallopeptidase [Candidatus Kapabacteria bacterium]|nr:M20 family metallopeptidase [Candidatus Kapabacteria bacterium]